MDQLDSCNPNKQHICHEMLAAVSIPLQSDEIAWFWVSSPWWMISNWNSRGPCSQSPGKFSLATMHVSQPPPELVGGLHIPKHNVPHVYKIYLDVFWRYILILVQWTRGFSLSEFEANLLWLLPGIQDLENHWQAEAIYHILQDLLFIFSHVFLSIWIIMIYRRNSFSTSSNISASRIIPCRRNPVYVFGMTTSQFLLFSDFWSSS